MEGGGVESFFWAWLEGCLYALGVIIPALGSSLRDDDRVLVPAVLGWAARVRGEAFRWENEKKHSRLTVRRQTTKTRST